MNASRACPKFHLTGPDARLARLHLVFVLLGLLGDRLMPSYDPSLPRVLQVEASVLDADGSPRGSGQRTSAKPRFVAQWQRPTVAQEAAGPSPNKTPQSAMQVGLIPSKNAAQERFDAEFPLALTALQAHLRSGVQSAQHRAYFWWHHQPHNEHSAYARL